MKKRNEIKDIRMYVSKLNLPFGVGMALDTCSIIPEVGDLINCKDASTEIIELSYRSDINNVDIVCDNGQKITVSMLNKLYNAGQLTIN
ncbi:MAG: hypothetical protein WC373_11740 [Smithella sp.]|jgi:hypothetical protein